MMLSTNRTIRSNSLNSGISSLLSVLVLVSIHCARDNEQDSKREEKVALPTSEFLHQVASNDIGVFRFVEQNRGGTIDRTLIGLNELSEWVYVEDDVLKRMSLSDSMVSNVIPRGTTFTVNDDHVTVFSDISIRVFDWRMMTDIINISTTGAKSGLHSSGRVFRAEVRPNHIKIYSQLNQQVVAIIPTSVNFPANANIDELYFHDNLIVFEFTETIGEGSGFRMSGLGIHNLLTGKTTYRYLPAGYFSSLGGFVDDVHYPLNGQAQFESGGHTDLFSIDGTGKFIKLKKLPDAECVIKVRKGTFLMDKWYRMWPVGNHTPSDDTYVPLEVSVQSREATPIQLTMKKMVLGIECWGGLAFRWGKKTVAFPELGNLKGGALSEYINRGVYHTRWIGVEAGYNEQVETFFEVAGLIARAMAIRQEPSLVSVKTQYENTASYERRIAKHESIFRSINLDSIRMQLDSLVVQRAEIKRNKLLASYRLEIDSLLPNLLSRSTEFTAYLAGLNQKSKESETLSLGEYRDYHVSFDADRGGLLVEFHNQKIFVPMTPQKGKRIIDNPDLVKIKTISEYDLLTESRTKSRWLMIRSEGVNIPIQ